jgi:hypothetical protein
MAVIYGTMALAIRSPRIMNVRNCSCSTRAPASRAIGREFSHALLSAVARKPEAEHKASQGSIVARDMGGSARGGDMTVARAPHSLAISD